MNKILLVEDDRKLVRFLQLELEHGGYDISIAYDGGNGFEKAEKESFDLIIMDIMLPGINGIELCRRIRKTSEIPIIILTAKDDISDKVTGLDAGADDYITKPFAIEEIFARIRSIGRRNRNKEIGVVLKNGPLTVDRSCHSVMYKDFQIELTGTEYKLLVFLLENSGTILSRDEIIENVWGYDFFGETNIVDVYISYLRSKIDQRFGTEIIKTSRGFGYLIRRDEIDE
ncbi:MAG: response regulator transcription factor [Clostridia bacterium]|nr:response regulator transcription factor [Clostridia bacterium]MBN2883670.1 response regulator transcription factor [Clostridia bacterium]